MITQYIMSAFTPSICLSRVIVILLSEICLLTTASEDLISTPNKKIVINNYVPINYTVCNNTYGINCADEVRKYSTECECKMNFNVNIPLEGDVMLFIQLDQFKQHIIKTYPNYNLSRDDKQLRGDLTHPPSEACQPFRYNDKKVPIAPCGATAATMFTEKFEIVADNEEEKLPFLEYNIVTPEEKAYFSNPPGNLHTAFGNFSKPINWTKNVWELDEKNNDNNGFRNERFIAWMIHAPLGEPVPVASLDKNNPKYKGGLPVGNYTLMVHYYYPFYDYNGSKILMLASTSIKSSNGSCNSKKLSITLITVLFIYLL